MTEINQHQKITSSVEKTKSVTTPMGFCHNDAPSHIVILTLWGPTSSYARQCVPFHEVQGRARLDTLYCAFCRFQEVHAIYYVLYELLGG